MRPRRCRGGHARAAIPDLVDSLSQPLAAFRSRRRRPAWRARSRCRTHAAERAGADRPRRDQRAARRRRGSGMGLRRGRDRPALHALGGPRRRELPRVHRRRVLRRARIRCASMPAALATSTPDTLGALFQVRDDNPLRRPRRPRGAAAAIWARRCDGRRPGALFDALTAQTAHASARRRSCARCSICWARSGSPAATLDGVALGDAWRHPHAGGDGATAGWVPFHKLSQWLAYSLFEPFEWAGVGGHRPRRR